MSSWKQLQIIPFFEATFKIFLLVEALEVLQWPEPMCFYDGPYGFDPVFPYLTTVTDQLPYSLGQLHGPSFPTPSEYKILRPIHHPLNQNLPRASPLRFNCTSSGCFINLCQFPDPLHVNTQILIIRLFLSI